MLLCVSVEMNAAELGPKHFRRVGWEFFCKACANEFAADWQTGALITCPRCQTVFETGWQFTDKGQLLGPWLTRRVEQQTQD